MKKLKFYFAALSALVMLSACETADLEPQGTSYASLEAFEKPMEVIVKLNLLEKTVSPPQR